jgi:hypothetical protein
MYCCDRFETMFEHKNRIYPNIRVVKFTSDFLLKNGHGIYITQKGIDTKFVKGSKSFYRYFIGYTVGSFEFGSPQFNMINYCPYCGQNLYELYNQDKYVNEIEGETFIL